MSVYFIFNAVHAIYKLNYTIINYKKNTESLWLPFTLELNGITKIFFNQTHKYSGMPVLFNAE